jgi:hypothetical protein
VGTKRVINNNIIEQVNSFNYLEYTITVTKSRYLEIKMNRLNEICKTVRRTLNDKPRKESQIKFCKAVAVPTLIYRSDATAELEFWRSVTGCTRKDQTRHTKVTEELNIFNLNAKSLNSRSQWKYHVQRTEDGRIQKKIPTYNPKRK